MQKILKLAIVMPICFALCQFFWQVLPLDKLPDNIHLILNDATGPAFFLSAFIGLSCVFLWKIPIINKIIHLSKIIGGEYDITIMPLIRLWGFYKQTPILPSFDKIKKAKRLVDYKKIIIDKKKKRVKIEKNQEIITGSFIKAYAIEKMVQEMKKIGIKDAIVNAGGSSIIAINEWGIIAENPEDEKEILRNINGMPVRITKYGYNGKNEDNVCLCGDVVSALPAPTTIEGLTQSFTTCATSSITLAYPAAAATYTGYTWSAVSPANALGYLSANNVATPTFLYNGANITSPLVVTYKLTLKRYNGCEAVQTVTVQVSPQGINLTTPAPLVVNCKNATASITQWLNSASAADTCGNAASVTHNYDTVKPADLCNNSGIVTVTFVGKDALGNTATQTRTITLVNIDAVDDDFTFTDGSVSTTSTRTVLVNDKVGNQTATIGTVSLTVITPAVGAAGSATPTLNANGTVTVPAGTKSGTYYIGYRICSTVASISVCDTATATIIVGTPTITADPDTFTITTGTSTKSVLDNDKIGTATATTNTVSISVVTGATPKQPGTNTPTLDSDGKVTVPNNTPAGTYTIVYQICDKLNSGNCATTTVTVVVGTTTPTAPVPVAVDDRATTPLNTPVTINVLGNDTPEGATPNVTTNPANGSVSVNSDGSIEYRPHTDFAGTDTFVYELCNASGCATATVTVEVIKSIVVYNAISLSSDKNDHFHIAGIESYPNNVVRIYNRWGVKVWEAEHYDNIRNVFKGISNGRVTVEAPNKLPQGTYYYVIEYTDEHNQQQSKTGWLYIKK